MIVLGLLLVALVATFTIYLLYRQGKQEVGQFILIVSNITSGLIGYMSRPADTKREAQPTDNPVNVTVTNQPENPVPVEEKP
jgi:hypothetical protein